MIPQNKRALIVSILLILFVNIDVFSQNQGNYIQLRTGKKIDFISVRYRNPLFKSPFLVVDADQEIDLLLIDILSQQGKLRVSRNVQGSGQATLLDVEYLGPISKFYIYRNQSTYDPYTGFYQNNGRVEYFIEKNKYETLKYNIRNMRMVTENHLPSLELVQQAARLNIYSYLAFGVSAGSAIYGLLGPASLQYESIGRNPYFYTSLGGAIAGGIVKSLVSRRLDDAFITYNKAFRDK